jgi:hypothetical protein
MEVVIDCAGMGTPDTAPEKAPAKKVPVPVFDPI